jgi:hypothetical protein
MTRRERRERGVIRIGEKAPLARKRSPLGGGVVGPGTEGAEVGVTRL